MADTQTNAAGVGATPASETARPAPAGANQARGGRGPVRYGLLGRTLGHSWSPTIHTQLGSVPYELVELEPDELEGYIREGRWVGLNVTIPYKQDAARIADVRSERVERLGAANTLWHDEEGRVVADNTDVLGFARMLRRFCERKLGAAPEELLGGRTVLVLGAGGASKAVQAVLADAGAAAVVVDLEGPETYDGLIERHPDAVLVVNATPVGMYPRCPATLLEADDLARLPKLLGVIDVVYNPERTGLCLAAESLGLPFESGLAMLVGQAVCSSELWQGTHFDDVLAQDIEASIRRTTRNLVLIGMPGSGKSSCARNLGALLGRTVVDLDDAFAERHGKSAAEVIEHEGEAHFRDLETEVLAEYGKRSGLVISCGGGVVCRPENRRLMHQNGTVIMLDRPISQLSSKGRPISRSRGVEALAAERMPLYRAWADHIVPCTGSARGDAEEIRRLLGL